MKTSNQEYIKNTNVKESDLICCCGETITIVHVSVWQGDKGVFYTECRKCGSEINVPWKRKEQVLEPKDNGMDFKGTIGNWYSDEYGKVLCNGEIIAVCLNIDSGKNRQGSLVEKQYNKTLIENSQSLLIALKDLRSKADKVNIWTSAFRPDNSKEHDILFKELECSLENAEIIIKKALK